MKPRLPLLAAATALALGLAACQPANEAPAASEPATETADASAEIAAKVAAYAEVPLTADLSHLSEGDREAIRLLLQAGKIMDDLFWEQVYGDKQLLLAGIKDEATRRFVEINYGPWDRLDGDAPFIDGVGPRPPGARFYPQDMDKEEFEAADLPGKDGLYTLVRRDDAGQLIVVPYHVEWADELGQASAPLTRVNRNPLPHAHRWLPAFLAPGFDLREVMRVHARGIAQTLDSATATPDPRKKARTLLAELYLMQHSCHWYCRSRSVASARLLVRHQTTYEQLLDAVSPATRDAYLKVVQG